MIDFQKELESILTSDPLGLLEVKPKQSSVISADERLVASFEEINLFVEERGCEPAKSRDISERRLCSRLRGLRDNPEKAAALIEFDRFGLLVDVILPEPDLEPNEINSIDDVLGDDVLGLLGDDGGDDPDSSDIFALKNVPASIDMPDKIAKRKPCQDFESFEHLFKQCHAQLSTGEKELQKFTGEQQISAGHFFILHGVMVYVAEVGEKAKKKGKANARLRCIFENGTESNMLLRSLATELYKDESGRRVLNPHDDIFGEIEQVTEKDEATGFIYVLHSLSDDQAIKEIDDLYKIGFSSQSTQQRIQNAERDPTYLMAGVELVAEFQTFNLNPQKLELLLHTFFAEACLNLDVFDGKGKRHTPREWFIVPLAVIETTIQLLINGEIIHYRYDPQEQIVVDK